MIIHELLKLKQVNIVAYHFRIQTILEHNIRKCIKNNIIHPIRNILESHWNLH